MADGDLANREDEELSALVNRCAHGDAHALRRIYLLQAPRLKGVALRITRSPSLAEDVLHDVFLKLWREAGRFDPARGPASAWLVLMTRFRAMELVRRGGRERTVETMPEQQDESPDPFAQAVGQAQNRRLQDCLATLPAPARRAITAAFVEGLTHAEISQLHNMPLGSVKSLIRRSLRDLRRCIDR
jgi:RNA polymerase sigma-70 factor (ECF subfamily)